MEIKLLGTIEVVVGDIMDQKAVDEAFMGVSAVYHICSALNTHEVEIGQIVINAARLAKVDISYIIQYCILYFKICRIIRKNSWLRKFW